MLSGCTHKHTHTCPGGMLPNKQTNKQAVARNRFGVGSSFVRTSPSGLGDGHQQYVRESLLRKGDPPRFSGKRVDFVARWNSVATVAAAAGGASCDLVVLSPSIASYLVHRPTNGLADAPFSGCRMIHSILFSFQRLLWPFISRAYRGGGRAKMNPRGHCLAGHVGRYF